MEQYPQVLTSWGGDKRLVKCPWEMAEKRTNSLPSGSSGIKYCSKINKSSWKVVSPQQYLIACHCNCPWLFFQNYANFSWLKIKFPGWFFPTISWPVATPTVVPNVQGHDWVNVRLILYFYITNFYWLPINCLGRVCLLCYSKEKKYLNVCCVQSTTTKCTCYQKGMFFFSKLSKRNASHVQSFILGNHTILKSSGHCKSKDQTKQECCISNWFSRVLYHA